MGTKVSLQDTVDLHDEVKMKEVLICVSIGVNDLLSRWRMIERFVDGFEVAGADIPMEPKIMDIPVYSWHLPYYTEPRSYGDLLCKIHNKLGVRYFVCHPQKGDIDGKKTQNFIEDVMQRVDIGVELSIEIMDKPDYPKPRLLVEIVRKLQSFARNIHINTCLDTSHVTPPENLPQVIDILGDSIGHLHLSDRVRKRNKLLKHQFPGEGCIDWKEILPKIFRYYRGHITIEPHVEFDEQWLIRLERAVEYIRGLHLKDI